MAHSTNGFADRRRFIGGSDARIVMGEVAPEDLSRNLVVQLGRVTEDLNRQWYEGNTGMAVSQLQRQVFHPVKRWMAATLDGMVEAAGAVFSRPSSCCHGPSRRRPQPKSIWPSYSTTCG
jgi:predicted phage-related endonuclease